MPKSSNQKLKIPTLIRILEEKTDENHGLKAEELIRELERYGIAAERKSIYDDIELLQTGLGLDIEHDKVRGYRLVDRDFQLSELKLLVDAVQSSRFISASKSDEVIRKLKGLTSHHHAAELQRQITVKDRIKSMNNATLYAVETLHEAILRDRQITFQYYQWNSAKQQVLRHDGKKYRVSPWMLLWDSEYYYLVSFDHERQEIRHYRVDRMKGVAVEEEPREGREAYIAVDVSDYSGSIFGMYGGKKVHVKFHCTENGKTPMADIVIDRFGKDVILLPDDDGFVFYADIELSPQFFGWVASFGDTIRILSPDEAVDAFRRQMTDALKQYE